MSRPLRGSTLALAVALMAVPALTTCENHVLNPADTHSPDPGLPDPGTDPGADAADTGATTDLPDVGDDLAEHDLSPDLPQDPGADPGPAVPCTTTLDCAILLDQPAPAKCQRPFCDREAGTCAWTPMPNGVACDAGDACILDARCRAGECVGRPRDCDDGSPCTTDSCDGKGECVHVNAEGPCDDGNACTASDSCKDGTCVGSDNACACKGDLDCAAREDGNRCNGTLACRQDACVIDPATVVTCAPATSPCLRTECVPADGSCASLPTGNGVACDDGDRCTQGDRCQQGTCGGDRTILCDDGNPCTDDACDAAGGCVFTPATRPCEDGNLCTTDDECRDGLCVGRPTTACGCRVDEDCLAKEDGDRCNGTLVCLQGQCVVDPATIVSCDPLPPGSGTCRVTTCAPATGECAPRMLNDGRPCDDGDACTLTSACLGGDCRGEGGPECGDDNACTDDFCDPAHGCRNEAIDGPCDDGNPCTLEDRCQEGACTPGTPRICDDGNPCTADECSAALGCVHPFNEAPCDDGNPCTVDDYCVQGKCLAGQLEPCLDDNPCTDDACDRASGCVHIANAAPCDDGDPCTASDACAGRECTAGEPRVCDDGDPCTADECIRDQGGCVTYPLDDEAPCSDGLECTVLDACRGGTCQGTDVCDDRNPCTADSCNEILGNCEYLPISGECDDGDTCTSGDTCTDGACTSGAPRDCDDGDACNGQESCQEGVGCVTGTPPACDDGNVCNGIETCDPANGCRAGIPPDCDDGDACNGQESCQEGVGCVTGTPPNCDDGNLCTDDLCDPVKGCWYLPNTAPCSDGNECTVGDTCGNGRCVGMARACDDGIACTKDRCDSILGCQYTPVAELCTPSGTECLKTLCLPDVGCTYEFNPAPGCCQTAGECDDGNACSKDVCEALLCSHLPIVDGSPCEDGDLCTAGDFCNADANCNPGQRDCGLQGCDADPQCPERDCTDGNDNNLDGRIDCKDPTCADQEACWLPIDWCRLQWPSSVSGIEGEMFRIYSRVYISGLTTVSPGTDPYPSVKAELGVGPDGSDPAVGATSGWAWTNSVPNPSYDPSSTDHEANNDEYFSDIPVRPYPGPYDYAARYSGDNGRTWVYCDRNAGSGSDGSQDGYQPEFAGDMQVRYDLAVTGTDYPIVPLGSKLAVFGRGFTLATEVTIASIRQPFTVLSDSMLVIPVVSANTPVGTQSLAVRSGEIVSKPYPVEIMFLEVAAPVAAHVPGLDSHAFNGFAIATHGTPSLRP